MRVEWRRSEEVAPPVDDPGEPELVERLRSEIEAHGPITFARFMERALYEPGLGYYATSTDRPTRSGDYLTAAELHPIFGHVLARRLDRMWRELGQPSGFTLREYGAGRGSLFLAVLDGLVRIDSELAAAIRYQPFDLPGQQSRIEQRLADAGSTHLLVTDDPASPFSGCAIANEFVDALPVHRVVVQDGVLCEIYVGWSAGQFTEIVGAPSDHRLAESFETAAVKLAEGQRAEVNLAMLDWIARLAEQLERGFVWVIDYGAAAGELYSAARGTGTVRAFRAQHVSSDVLGAVGHQDITAHVDFDALERAARGAGLEVIDRTRQAEFLLANGLDEAYAAERAAADSDWSAALTLRSAVRRLLDPAALGGYGVLTLGKKLN
jgi:SAM-dependent MidA family methyltransferase